MLPSIKLRGHLHRSSGQSASAVTIISIDQTHQQGVEFEAFCLKINEEYKERNLTNLTIIETGYLKRHYLRLDTQFSSIEEADCAAMQLGLDWKNQQQSSLDQLKLPCEIISWKEIIESQAGEKDVPFSKYLAKIEADYKTDKVFRNHVNTISKKYAEKLAAKYNPERLEYLYEACFKAARDYLLEESSIIFKLVQRDFSCQLYPGTGNAALRYIQRKYFGEKNPMPWLRYDIQYPKQEIRVHLKESESFFFNNTSPGNNLKHKNHIKKLFIELPQAERLNLLQELAQETKKTEELQYGNA